MLSMEMSTVETQSVTGHRMLESLKITDALTLFDLQSRSEDMARSSMRDLTPLAKYTTDGKVLFHRASFTDYILDKSRSGDYFVDIPALSGSIALKI